MRVYDCFMLFNEADVLEVRLGELYDHVDVFVVVESMTTFAGRPKAPCYHPDDPRWAPFRDKVRWVVLQDMPVFTAAPRGSRWLVEITQRNAILRGLGDASYDDVVMVSDADEIPRGTSVDNAKKMLKKAGRKRSTRLRIKLHLDKYQGYADRIEIGDLWCAPTAVTLQTMINRRLTPSNVRTASNDQMDTKTLERAGWHFCFCGGVPLIAEKLDNYSHDELPTIPPETIEQRLRDSVDVLGRGNVGIRRVALGPRHPRYLLDHQERLSALIGG